MRRVFPIYFSAVNFYSLNNINVLQGKRQIVLEKGTDFAALLRYCKNIVENKRKRNGITTGIYTKCFGGNSDDQSDEAR